MKNVWQTDNRKTTYLNPGRYIAVRVTETKVIFYPCPKFRAKDIRKKLKGE